MHPLNADPLPWLLAADNPSVRYWTLVDLLDRPPNDSDVLAARAALLEQPLVQQLFALQQPGGYWGADETKPYTADGTLGVLALLHMLGVPPDARTAAGCDSFLRFSQNANGGFSLTRTIRSGIFPCTTGEHLPFLVYFGFGADPRLHRAIEFLIESHSAEAALVCARYQNQACLWGAISALNGLAVLPAELCTPRAAWLAARLADALLSAGYDFDGEHKRWLTFGVPRHWDLLSALLALARAGFAADPRCAPLLERVLALQDHDGRWLCGSVSRTWVLERRNQPSKWVTLDALCLLKHLGLLESAVLN